MLSKAVSFLFVLYSAVKLGFATKAKFQFNKIYLNKTKPSFHFKAVYSENTNNSTCRNAQTLSNSSLVGELYCVARTDKLIVVA